MILRALLRKVSILLRSTRWRYLSYRIRWTSKSCNMTATKPIFRFKLSNPKMKFCFSRGMKEPWPNLSNSWKTKINWLKKISPGLPQPIRSWGTSWQSKRKEITKQLKTKSPTLSSELSNKIPSMPALPSEIEKSSQKMTPFPKILEIFLRSKKLTVLLKTSTFKNSTEVNHNR